jgi:hypothetical protein
VVIFAFASITLNAMQVATSATNVSPILLTTSYRFSIAILIAIVGLMTAMAVVFIPLITVDLRGGMILNKRMAREMRRQSSV